MGAEKALHIKAPAAGRVPDCLVLNVTVRAMKMHGDGFESGGGRRPTPDELESENVEAVRAGAASNLRRHVRNLSQTGLPVVVSINRFKHDTDAELDAIREEAIDAGAREVVLNEGFAKGGGVRPRWPTLLYRPVQTTILLADPILQLWMKACQSRRQFSEWLQTCTEPTLSISAMYLKSHWIHSRSGALVIYPCAWLRISIHSATSPKC